MNKIFISYSSKEYEVASKFRAAFTERGMSCWMAPESIPIGSNYAVEIPKAIQDCKVFVLILSDNSQNSIWVRKEIDLAVNLNKLIFPIKTGNYQLISPFNFYLTNVQMMQATDEPAQIAAKLDCMLNPSASDAAETGNYSGAAPAPQPQPQVQQPQPQVQQPQPQVQQPQPQVQQPQPQPQVQQPQPQVQQPQPQMQQPQVQQSQPQSVPSGAEAAKKPFDIHSKKGIAVIAAAAAVFVAVLIGIVSLISSSGGKGNPVGDDGSFSVSISGSYYTGQYSGDMTHKRIPNGEGLFNGKDSNGNSINYFGEFKNGEVNGKGTGTYSYTNGETYIYRKL